MKKSRDNIIKLAYQNPRFKLTVPYPEPNTRWAFYLFDHPKHRLRAIRDIIEDHCAKELK